MLRERERESSRGIWREVGKGEERREEEEKERDREQGERERERDRRKRKGVVGGLGRNGDRWNMRRRESDRGRKKGDGRVKSERDII